jgi:hypothetical protein
MVIDVYRAGDPDILRPEAPEFRRVRHFKLVALFTVFFANKGLAKKRIPLLSLDGFGVSRHRAFAQSPEEA